MAQLYKELEIKPLDELDMFELELVSIGGLLEDEDLSEQQRHLQQLAAQLTGGAYAEQVGIEKTAFSGVQSCTHSADLSESEPAEHAGSGLT